MTESSEIPRDATMEWTAYRRAGRDWTWHNNESAASHRAGAQGRGWEPPMPMITKWCRHYYSTADCDRGHCCTFAISGSVQGLL